MNYPIIFGAADVENIGQILFAKNWTPVYQHILL